MESYIQMGNITVVVNSGGFNAVDIASICISLIAVGVALWSYSVSQKAYGIQSFEEYFDINEFVMKCWKTLTPFTPLGKCKNEEEANIRLFLYHELNRFNLERDKSRKNLHKKFSRAMYGNSIQDFKGILKSKEATDETADLAADILKKIHKEDRYFTSKFRDEFFGPNYFDC
jgi:hypothetical protein